MTVKSPNQPGWHRPHRLGYYSAILLRFITYALPALLLLLALFGFAVELFDAEPHRGSVIRLALFDTPRIPAPIVLGTWLMEASGLLALFLLARGRCGAWWLDGLVAGWLAWIFRGPLLVITIVVAARQPQHAWWTLAFGWWVLYSICGLFLARLAQRIDLEGTEPRETEDGAGAPEEPFNDPFNDLGVSPAGAAASVPSLVTPSDGDFAPREDDSEVEEDRAEEDRAEEDRAKGTSAPTELPDGDEERLHIEHDGEQADGEQTDPRARDTYQGKPGVEET